MKKWLLIAITSVLLLTGCSTKTPSLEYNVTAISDIKSWMGKEVSVTGYMSQASPTDGSYIYLMDVPLQIDTPVSGNGITITNTIICFPKVGTTVSYTGKCVKVTGTIIIDEKLWYLADCSYEVVAPNDEISAYNEVVDSEPFIILDKWINAVLAGLQDKASAKKVSSAEYESLMLSGLTDTQHRLKGLVSELTSLTKAYNEWVDSAEDDKSALEEAYSKVQQSTVEWIKALRVTGGC